MKRLLFIILLGSLICQTSFVVRAEEGPSSWAANEINQLDAMAILREDIFCDYQSNISRLDYAYLIYKLYEAIADAPISEICELTALNNFSDCGDYYVVALYKAGIINGYEDGTFRPEATITREEVACLYVRALEKAGINLSYDREDLDHFEDFNSFSDWAEESLLKCYYNRIMQGDSDSTMNPNGNTTKEESLVIFQRILTNKDYVTTHETVENDWSNLQFLDGHLYYVVKDIFGKGTGIKKYNDFTYIETLLECDMDNEILGKDNNIYYIENNVGMLAYNLTTNERVMIDSSSNLKTENVSKVNVYIEDENTNENIERILSEAREYVVIGQNIVYINDNKELLVYSIINNEESRVSNSQFENITYVYNYLSVDEILREEESSLIFNHLLPAFYLKEYFYH
jgi:hypothetical protein